ncbi:MAG: ABC transporter substrate-binding protein, partial [Sulfobacillus thermotolerans]|nr:ABC transporter substrate-binding protein [Sulfobacillus thermotolerans]
ETSSASEFSALKTGALTIGYLPLSLWKSRHTLTHDRIISGYVWGMTYLQPNESPTAPNGTGMLFHQLYIRQALAYGINQPAIIAAFYHGHGIIGDGPIPEQPKTPYYDTALNQPIYSYNPTQGRSILLAHGWKDTRGIMMKNGKPLAFTLNYNAGSQTVTDIVQLLKTDWAKEGIEVNLVSTPFDSLIALPPSKWSMIWLGLGSWIYSPDYYPTGGALFKTNAALNGEDYSNTTMNSLIDQTYAPYTSTSQELSRLDQYQMFAARHIPVIWMPYSATNFVVSNHLHGFSQSLNWVSGLIYPNLWTNS